MHTNKIYRFVIVQKEIFANLEVRISRFRLYDYQFKKEILNNRSLEE
jgi:hypothetical protein